ncbi:MAG: 2'-5' RNA ligase family protein [Sarcina sp.]
MKRCIMIFLKFDNIDIIEGIRKKYDPTFNFVEPHITLVFPFESDLTKKEIEEHMNNVLKGTKKFKVELQDVVSKKSFGNYIFLEVKKGVENLRELHEKLYTGILKKFLLTWLDDVKFIPHMTVGDLKNQDEVQKALEDLSSIKDEFTTMVTEISVELMYEDGSSEIEFVKKLD